jgi:hypothetical protein
VLVVVVVEIEVEKSGDYYLIDSFNGVAIYLSILFALP